MFRVIRIDHRCGLICFLRDLEAFTRNEIVPACTRGTRRKILHMHANPRLVFSLYMHRNLTEPIDSSTCEAKRDNVYLWIYVYIFFFSISNLYQFNLS